MTAHAGHAAGCEEPATSSKTVAGTRMPHAGIGPDAADGKTRVGKNQRRVLVYCQVRLPAKRKKQCRRIENRVLRAQV